MRTVSLVVPQLSTLLPFVSLPEGHFLPVVDVTTPFPTALLSKQVWDTVSVRGDPLISFCCKAGSMLHSTAVKPVMTRGPRWIPKSLLGGLWFTAVLWETRVMVDPQGMVHGRLLAGYGVSQV